MITPAAKRKAACVMVTEFRRSQRRACDLSGLGRSTYRYQSTRAEDDEIRRKLREIALERPGCGYRPLGYFLRTKGVRCNHKKLLRLYRAEGLGLPRKRPRKRLWQRPKPLLPASCANERWSIDFVSDQLGSGRRFRVFTVLAWAEARGIELRFIQPGKPNQNAFVESFNGKLRAECLSTHWFTTIADAKRVIETWRIDYNEVRPHSSLGNRPPSEFALAHRTATA